METVSNFDSAVQFVLDHEGGLSENVKDRGGITNFGISLRFLREVKEENLRRYGIFGEVNENTIRDLTLAQAKFIYKGEFWEGHRFDEIESQPLCHYIFDMVVNHGMANAIKLVQGATWAATFTRNYLRADGIMGSRTIAAINALGDALLPVLVATRVGYYQYLALVWPSDEVFLDGWLNRAYAAL